MATLGAPWDRRMPPVASGEAVRESTPWKPTPRRWRTRSGRQSAKRKQLRETGRSRAKEKTRAYALRERVREVAHGL
jgi:hypothetical protein